MHKLVTAAVLACAGCAGTGSWGGSAGGGTYTTDHGTVHRGIATLTHDFRPYLVLIVAGGDPTSCSGGPPGSGTIKSVDGREIAWTCNLRSGKLAINGQSFRLEDGAVALVDLRDGKFVVEQAAVDMKQFEGGYPEEQLKVLAATDQRIARIIKISESPK